MNNREEQIEQARRLIATGISEDLLAVLYQQFPELKESEDKRIRNDIMEAVENWFPYDYERVEEIRYYLERQKEPLTPEEKMNHQLYLEGFDVGKKVGEVLKELKPAEWSEEDELMRTAVIQTLERFGGRGTTGMQIDWLKSLRPQPHWKPSEEQMEWLESAVKLSTDKPHIHGIIISLYEQLKRL